MYLHILNIPLKDQSKKYILNMQFFTVTPGEIFKHNILDSNWMAFSVSDVLRSFLNTTRLNYSTRMLLSLVVFDVTVTSGRTLVYGEPSTRADL